MYAEYLRYVGFRVATAVTAEEALQIAFDEAPAVIVMDLALPAMDGATATRRLKRDRRTATTKIIVVSGHATTEHRRRSLAAGADDFCSKPCVPSEILTKVRALMLQPQRGTAKRRRNK